MIQDCRSTRIRSQDLPYRLLEVKRSHHPSLPVLFIFRSVSLFFFSICCFFLLSNGNPKDENLHSIRRNSLFNRIEFSIQISFTQSNSYLGKSTDIPFTDMPYFRTFSENFLGNCLQGLEYTFVQSSQVSQSSKI